MKIVLVDYSKFDRKLLADFLRSEDFEVIEAENGEEGLKLVASTVPDMVILEIVMPGISGFQACRQLKSDPSTAHMPVVMVTSRMFPQDMLWAKRQGADGYVTKPWTADGIRAAIEQLKSLPEWRAKTEKLELSETIGQGSDAAGSLRI